MMKDERTAGGKEMRGVVRPGEGLMSALPTGTVTFLFTDVEGSTRLWEEHPAAMREALAQHDALIEHAVATHGGVIVRPRGEGDSRFAVFARASDALGAAVAIQRALAAEVWPVVGPLRVRVALHTGEAELRAGDYYGAAVNRCARLRAAGHGGQTLVSQATAVLVQDHLPAGVSLGDLGHHRLKDLTSPEHIFELTASDVPAGFPPLRTLETRPHNLPVQSAPLIGRARELAALRALLGRERDLPQPGAARVVTLTGPGGTGKTRLALQLAADLLDSFTDGAFLVDLAPLADPALVAATVATTLGLGERGAAPLTSVLLAAAGATREAPPEELLVAFLREKEILLVLDNFEQVAATAPLISRLLAAAPRLVVVVTSRVPLHLYAEQEFPVTPLGLPPRQPPPDLAALSQYEAVALFIQRARLAQPSFAVTNDTAPTVAEICARLDGLPLAIELAAARMKMLSPQALLDRLGSRLRVLTGGARDLPARQQTLRAAIDWSYQLLTPDEQILFARLAVFAGGRTLEAIEAVCTTEGDLDIFAGVESLLDKNLLRREDEAAVGEPRFVMLETLHEYAREQLAARGELAWLRERHAHYFLALAEEAEQVFRGVTRASGAEVAHWLDRVEAEHDNLRAALHWTREAGRAEEGLRLTAALFLLWTWRGHGDEARRWVEEMLAAPPEAAGPRTGPLAAARVRVLLAAADLAGPRTDARRARSAESLALARAAGDRRGMAEALRYVGDETALMGDYDRGMAVLEESAALWRAVGDPMGLMMTLYVAGQLAWGRGDYARMEVLAEESLTVCRGLGYALGIAAALRGLGYAAYARSELARARALWEEALVVLRDLRLPAEIATELGDLGYLAHAQGDLTRAAALAEESLALRREIDDRWGSAHALGLLGVVAHRQGDEVRAVGLHRQALTLWREIGEGLVQTAYCLEHLAEVLAVPATLVSDERRAAVLLGTAAALRGAIGFHRPPVEQPELERVIEELRAALSLEGFARAWAEGEALSVEKAISLALNTASPAASEE